MSAFSFFQPKTRFLTAKSYKNPYFSIVAFSGPSPKIDDHGFATKYATYRSPVADRRADAKIFTKSNVYLFYAFIIEPALDGSGG